VWFEEFLENSQKKKTESVDEIEIFQPAKIAVAMNPQEGQIIIRKNIGVDKINISFPTSPIHPAKMQTKKVQVRRFAADPIRKAPIANFAPRKMMQLILQDEPKLRNVSVAEKNRYAVPLQEIKFKKRAGVFSPDLSMEEKVFAPIFSRFAFAAGFTLIVALMAASGYFVWSGGLFAKGTVAGASDERNAGFSGIISEGEHTLASAGDKMKESLSISRVMAAAAKEKNNAEIK
jgi:hypothetical protein